MNGSGRSSFRPACQVRPITGKRRCSQKSHGTKSLGCDCPDTVPRRKLLCIKYGTFTCLGFQRPINVLACWIKKGLFCSSTGFDWSLKKSTEALWITRKVLKYRSGAFSINGVFKIRLRVKWGYVDHWNIPTAKSETGVKVPFELFACLTFPWIFCLKPFEQFFFSNIELKSWSTLFYLNFLQITNRKTYRKTKRFDNKIWIKVRNLNEFYAVKSSLAVFISSFLSEWQRVAWHRTWPAIFYSCSTSPIARTVDRLWRIRDALNRSRPSPQLAIPRLNKKENKKVLKNFPIE